MYVPSEEQNQEQEDEHDHKATAMMPKLSDRIIIKEDRISLGKPPSMKSLLSKKKKNDTESIIKTKKRIDSSG